MGDIRAFLQPPVMDETREVMISKRFKDSEGKPRPFLIRVIDQETNGKLIKQATIRTKVNGLVTQELDSDRYGKLLVASCVVEPNIKDAEICKYYKTMDPLEVPGRMLTAGEYGRLVKAIKQVNDMVTSEEEFEELREEAKNS